jgi:leader peptidase (prepilin peptidase) / N-methyltransferase
MLMSELPRWFVLSLCVGLGLLFGSFLNVVIHRLPREENIAFPASRCPGCGTPIRPYDNVPVLSWLLLRGKARCCGARISVRYPLVELLGGLLAWGLLEMRVFPQETELSVAAGFGLFAAYLALGLGLLAAAAIDLEHMYLPDSITLGGALLGLATVPLRPEVGWLDATGGALLGFLFVWLPFIWLYAKLRGFPGMGLGDAKLLALAGAWFGPFGTLFVLFGGALQGTLVALAVLITKGKLEEPEAVRQERRALLEAIEASEGAERQALERELALDPIGTEPAEGIGQARLAFGPFLVLGCIELLLFQEPIRAVAEEFLWAG